MAINGLNHLRSWCDFHETLQRQNRIQIKPFVCFTSCANDILCTNFTSESEILLRFPYSAIENSDKTTRYVKLLVIHIPILFLYLFIDNDADDDIYDRRHVYVTLTVILIGVVFYLIFNFFFTQYLWECEKWECRWNRWRFNDESILPFDFN